MKSTLNFTQEFNTGGKLHRDDPEPWSGWTHSHFSVGKVEKMIITRKGYIIFKAKFK